MSEPAGQGAALDAVVQFYESLGEASLARIGVIYAADAAFKDPFNAVRGVPAITAIFRHMYVKVDAPRFVVTSRVLQGDDAFLTWDFNFRFKGDKAPQTIRGATHLRFDHAGQVTLHRDYWDAAEELYEKLPLLGSLMRWLKRRANR